MAGESSDDLDDVLGVREARAEGFMPIEELMGEVEFARTFPEQHFRAIRDSRYEPDPEASVFPGLDDGQLLLVRSPWPSIDIETAVKLMFRWLKRNEDSYLLRENGWVGRVDKAAELALVEQFFRQTEAWVRAYQRGRANPTS